MSSLFKILQRTSDGLSGLGEFAPGIVGSADEGAIIERGSNANGEYVKFADGTMWRRGKSSLGEITVGANDNGVAAHVFPASFADSNASVVISANGYAATRFTSAVRSSSVTRAGFSSAHYSVTTQGWELDGSTCIYYIAVGLWK